MQNGHRQLGLLYFSYYLTSDTAWRPYLHGVVDQPGVQCCVTQRFTDLQQHSVMQCIRFVPVPVCRHAAIHGPAAAQCDTMHSICASDASRSNSQTCSLAQCKQCTQFVPVKHHAAIRRPVAAQCDAMHSICASACVPSRSDSRTCSMAEWQKPCTARHIQLL